jgi:hypothetical protein
LTTNPEPWELAIDALLARAEANRIKYEIHRRISLLEECLGINLAVDQILRDLIAYLRRGAERVALRTEIRIRELHEEEVRIRAGTNPRVHNESISQLSTDAGSSLTSSDTTLNPRVP